MTRTATWSAIGNDVSNLNDIESVLKASNLDYEVKKCNVFTTLADSGISSQNAIGVNNALATVNQKTGRVFGLVGGNYEVCNNRDAFDFVNYIGEDIKFVKAGETGAGMVYVIASLPDVNVLGDQFTPYVIFQNGFNGAFTIKATICPLRIVCQNQFNVAFKESPNTISIRHTHAMHDKLVEAREVLSRTADYMKIMNNQFERYAMMKFPADRIGEIVEEIFPVREDMRDATKEKVISARNEFILAYDQEDNRNFRGSLMGLINAEADYLTHRAPARQTKNWEDNKFTSVTLSPLAMAKFIELVSSKVS